MKVKVEDCSQWMMKQTIVTIELAGYSVFTMQMARIYQDSLRLFGKLSKVDHVTSYSFRFRGLALQANGGRFIPARSPILHLDGDRYYLDVACKSADLLKVKEPITGVLM